MRLYPIYHPAAALYTPRMLETLREDFARLPDLLAMGPPDQPSAEPVPEARGRVGAAGCPAAPSGDAEAQEQAEADQLGSVLDRRPVGVQDPSSRIAVPKTLQ